MTVGSIAIRSELWMQGGVVEIDFGDECFVKNEEINKNNVMKIATIHTHTHTKKIMAGSFFWWVGGVFFFAEGYGHSLSGEVHFFFSSYLRIAEATISNLKKEIERAWKMVEAGGIRAIPNDEA